MSTAVATTSNDLPAAPKPDKPKRVDIRGKLKRALDLMVYGDESGKRYDHITAPRAVGFSTSAMRKALERPHVVRYLQEQKQVFRKSLSAANIHVLGEIRDDSGNAMARLGAVKLLEQMDERAPAASSAYRNVTPGVVVIVNAQRSTPLIDHQALIEINPLIDKAEIGHDE